ncbi:hypothetical protein BXZ70DRAFT_481748 [Cristinia sonorae]|uniref:Uncharacterized protein n=1 Tax=Cristinia sonorae TaxID=1940300 RepID=A0A8K0UGX9_9AGAR|nr:hypothetical protein BXZ70DRAFT_481748 [Cristinia sonorae]
MCVNALPEYLVPHALVLSLSRILKLLAKLLFEVYWETIVEQRLIKSLLGPFSLFERHMFHEEFTCVPGHEMHNYLQCQLINIQVWQAFPHERSFQFDPSHCLLYKLLTFGQYLSLGSSIHALSRCILPGWSESPSSRGTSRTFFVWIWLHRRCWVLPWLLEGGRLNPEPDGPDLASSSARCFSASHILAMRSYSPARRIASSSWADSSSESMA